MKFTSKRELIERIEREHAVFIELAASIPRSLYRESGVWGDGWNVADLFAHLAEWHRMFLAWHRDGSVGREPRMPAPGFKWNETPKLNRAIQRRHARRSVATLVAEFDATHAEVLALAKSLSQAQLLEAGHFAWTGKHPLSAYLAPNTCHHYSVASKILKRWLRSQHG